MIENTKQVIVMRKFKGLRTGKYCAQASHASMAFLTRKLSPTVKCPELGFPYHSNPFTVEFDNILEIQHWLENSFRKIVCYVDTEEELLAIHQKALDNGLMSHIIEDNGATEFNGVKTLTCCAIGPHFCHRFEGLTDHLPLL